MALPVHLAFAFGAIHDNVGELPAKFKNRTWTALTVGCWLALLCLPPILSAKKDVLVEQKACGVPGERKTTKKRTIGFACRQEQTDPATQFNLGFMYGTGTGVAQDYEEAIRWFRLAAEKGYAAAQFNLGVLYANGTGVPQDYKEATRWFRLAADQGYAAAQLLLGSTPGTETIQSPVTSGLAGPGGVASKSRRSEIQ
jgi:TPR repeat protein